MKDHPLNPLSTVLDIIILLFWNRGLSVEEQGIVQLLVPSRTVVQTVAVIAKDLSSGLDGFDAFHAQNAAESRMRKVGKSGVGKERMIHFMR